MADSQTVNTDAFGRKGEKGWKTYTILYNKREERETAWLPDSIPLSSGYGSLNGARIRSGVLFRFGRFRPCRKIPRTHCHELQSMAARHEMFHTLENGVGKHRLPLAFLPNCSEIPNSCVFIQFFLLVYILDMLTDICLAGLKQFDNLRLCQPQRFFFQPHYQLHFVGGLL